MHLQNPDTTPSVASSSTRSSNHKLDPIAVLREELAAAAICHGVERVEDLTEALVDRYVQRLGGLTVYVRNDRVKVRERLAAQIRANFDGRNAKDLARKHHLSVRQVQRILMSRQNVV